MNPLSLFVSTRAGSTSKDMLLNDEAHSNVFSFVADWLNLYNNGFTGPIPDNLRWRQMFYFDVGYNQLTGQLPDDLGDKFASLRHLHLDHNQFSGTLPAPYTSVGGNRLESLTVDHNRLGGAVPSSYVLYNKLGKKWAWLASCTLCSER
jgi:hypothetical protein